MHLFFTGDLLTNDEIDVVKCRVGLVSGSNLNLNAGYFKFNKLLF